MKHSFSIPFVLIIALIMVFSSCFKKDTVSPIPAIEFKGFVANKDTANLYISFEDGDGDIGLSQNDTTPPNNYNCFITYIEKQHGVWVKRTLPFEFNYRIPNINTSGKKKDISGEIAISLKPYYYDPFSHFDTIKYELYIVDKALNKSNIIETREIITPK